MKSLRRILMLAGALCASLAASAAWAADDKVVIGDIDDMSGPYADVIGAAGIEAIKMAIADFGGTALGQPIEILTFDHQNKPVIAAQKLREWADTEGLTMQLGGSNTGVSLAMSAASKEKKIPLHRHRRGRRVADRQGLHALYDPLRLRHDRARQRHGENHSRGRRQELVLPHRRLRLRQAIGSRRPPKSSRRAAETCSAASACPSGRRISPPICSRRRARARRCLGSPTPAPTPPTRSRRRRNSASPRRCGLRRFWCSLPTFTRWVFKSPRGWC